MYKQLFSYVQTAEVMDVSKTRLQFAVVQLIIQHAGQQELLLLNRNILRRYFCVWYVTN